MNTGQRTGLHAGRHYRTRIVASLAEIDAASWDALAFPRPDANPFLRHAFLTALEATGCANPASGWTPCHLTLWDGPRLVAATPLYAKDHSYGEYVFDWAWADAYQRHGLGYYPKLLSAIPCTPVAGPRLLATDEHARGALAAALVEQARASGASSLHVLFPETHEGEVLREHGLMLRHGVQFHWENLGWPDFDAFLDSLERKKRKNIRAERRKVAEAGVTLRRVAGAQAEAGDWKFFTRCYNHTYRAHHSSPYLNLEFFQRIGAAMPENLLLVIAERAGRPIAASLVVHTPTTLYGRYWGEVEHVPCLHFECAYYQPLEFCIARGIRWFEGGAQGEHKMARGFLPVRTRSAHWLAHPGFADAVERFLQRETAGIDHYIDELHEHQPFRQAHARTEADCGDDRSPGGAGHQESS